MINCKFNSVNERDIDLLLLEAIGTDPDFATLFINKTDLKGRSFCVVSEELSKANKDGESDLTIIIECGERRYGLLIEDKIDAPAMPKQHQRYIKRGNTGIDHNDYQDFKVFIVCPQKYYEGDKEAKKYEHFVSFEECISYFEAKTDAINRYRAQQMKQATEKAKKPRGNTVDPKANEFFQKYIAFQKEYYKGVHMKSDSKSSGVWVEFGTTLGRAYIIHKSDRGYVDLTFPNAVGKRSLLEHFAEWARREGLADITAEPTGKSAALRIKVPPIDFYDSFSKVQHEDLHKCFSAIQKLTELANSIEDLRQISELD